MCIIYKRATTVYSWRCAISKAERLVVEQGLLIGAIFRAVRSHLQRLGRHKSIPHIAWDILILKFTCCLSEIQF